MGLDDIRAWELRDVYEALFKAGDEQAFAEFVAFCEGHVEFLPILRKVNEQLKEESGDLSADTD